MHANRSFLKSVCMSAALAFCLPIAATLPLATAALANGNGNGNGHGNGGGGDHGGSGGGNDHSGRDGSGDQDGGRASASELGSLNAAHASAEALEHASPNSVPGKLARYKAGVEHEEQLRSEIEAQEAAIAALNPQSPDYQAELAADTAELQTLRHELWEQRTTDRETLESAANKPLTRAVVRTVNELLGLD